MDFERFQELHILAGNDLLVAIKQRYIIDTMKNLMVIGHKDCATLIGLFFPSATTLGKLGHFLCVLFSLVHQFSDFLPAMTKIDAILRLGHLLKLWIFRPINSPLNSTILLYRKQPVVDGIVATIAHSETPQLGYIPLLAIVDLTNSRTVARCSAK